MADRNSFFQVSLQTTLKNRRLTASSVLKKNYHLLQKFNAADRPLNINCSQKTSIPKEN